MDPRRRPAQLILALVAIGLGAPVAGAAAPPPKRLAVLTPYLTAAAGEDLECAAMVLADGLTEALAERMESWRVLDRALVRTLERESLDTGADLDLALSLSLGDGGPPRSIEVRLSPGVVAPDAFPATLAERTFRGDDPGALTGDIAGAITTALQLPPSTGRPPVPFPIGAACARLASALARFDPADRTALSEARADLEAAARIAPEDPRVLATLAEVHIRLGRIDDGIALAKKAIDRAPRLSVAHWALALGHDYGGRPELALSAYRDALAHPPGLVTARLNAGLIEMRRERLAPALGFLFDVVERAPSWYFGRFNLAVALIEAGDGAAARAQLEASSRWPRLSEERLILLASARILTLDPDNALALVQPLASDARMGAFARVVQAHALALGDDPQRALTALAAALEETTQQPRLTYLRPPLLVARARALIAADRRDEALDELRKHLTEREDPLLQRALIVLGGVPAPDRRGALEALVAEHPSDHESWYDLGVLHQRAGELDKASQAYERAIEHNPRASWARYNRGLVALAQGDPEGALAWLTVAQEMAPEADDIRAALEAARARAPTATPPGDRPR